MVKRAKSKPFIKNVSVGYNFPRSASIKNNILSISTIDGRIKVPFSVPDCFKNYFNSWNICESLLMIDKFNKCFFMFTFYSSIETTRSNIQKRVLGVDAGVYNLAVTSERRFYGGKHIRHLRKKYEMLISELQSKGTRASKRKLKKLSGRWSQFMRWVNHNISKDIVSNLSSGDVVVMEDLKDIRRTAKYNKWVHKWAFRQLQSFIEYKALRKGIRVVYINPKYTSKECSVCHDKKTTRIRGFIKCNVCGHQTNSDLMASINIAGRYILSSRADVNLPIFSSNDSLLRVCHCEHGVCDEVREKPYPLG